MQADIIYVMKIDLHNKDEISGEPGCIGEPEYFEKNHTLGHCSIHLTCTPVI